MINTNIPRYNTRKRGIGANEYPDSTEVFGAIGIFDRSFANFLSSSGVNSGGGDSVESLATWQI